MARDRSRSQRSGADAAASSSLFGWLGDLMRRPASVDRPLDLSLVALRAHFRYAALFSAVVSILYLSSSLYMMLVYDKVLTSGSHFTLAVLTIALFAALATLAWLDMTRTRLFIRAGLRLDRRLSGTIIDAVLASSSTGDPRSTQLLREFDQFRGVITGQPMLALFDAPWAPIYIIVLFIIHWSLALLAIVGGILFFLVARWSEHRMREPTRRSNEMSTAINVSLESSLVHAGPIRALGMAVPLRRMWAKRREESLGSSASAAFDGSFATGTLRFLRLLWQSLALGLGAWLAIDGAIAPGAMIASSILLGRALTPLEQIVSAWKPLVSAADNYGRLTAALDRHDTAQAARTELPPMRGKVDVENVVIINPHNPSAPPILGGVGFSIQPGETVAIVGPSGAGKTSLVRALVGLTPLATGNVRYDGADLSQWRPQALASMIGYLPQEIALLPGTVRDNVSRFEAHGEQPPSDTDQAVIAACTQAGIHDDILRLPKGYDMPIEAGGVHLSGGQRQRIALARALFRDPALLILDEPNAHLDRDGEAALIASLQKLRADGRTVILVTHRVNLLVTSQKVLSLMGGRVHKFGPRDEVLAAIQKGGLRVVPPQTTSSGGGILQ